MNSSIVKVTAKGQISIPKKMQDEIGIQKGDELVILMHEGAITMRKIRDDDFADLLTVSGKVAEELWSSPEDDVWDTV